MTTAQPTVRREAASPYGEWADAIDQLISYRYLASRPWLLMRRDLRASGGVLAAPLAIAMLDAAGINVDPIHVLALTHIDLQLLDPALDVREVHLHSHVTREARSQVFTETTMFDADDQNRAVGFGTANWSVIVPTTGEFHYPEAGAGIADSPDAPPLWEAYTGRRRPDGLLEIPGLSPLIGTERLHHGPMLVISEAAALAAVVERLGDVPLAIEHLAMSIVSPGRAGPFVTHAELIGEQRQVIGCRVELRDEGVDDRVVARTFLRVRAA
jgi:acyl-coenzyme A thioesterase PaaI-like protein